MDDFNHAVEVAHAFAGGISGEDPRGQSRCNGGKVSTSQGGNGSHPFQGSWPNKMKGKERDDSCCKKKPRDDPPSGKDSKTQAGFRLACPFYCQNRSAYAQCQKDIDLTFANVIQHILREPAAPPLPRLKRTFEGRKCADSLNKQHEHY